MFQRLLIALKLSTLPPHLTVAELCHGFSGYAASPDAHSSIDIVRRGEYTFSFDAPGLFGRFGVER